MGEARNMEATRNSQPISFEAYGGSAPENYEQYFVPVIGTPLATDLVDVAALRPGERVLDVACGTGVVARLAAERIGATGTVAGIDINPGMLGVARSVTPAGLPIEWHRAAKWLNPILSELLARPIEQGFFYNVNLPHLPPEARDPEVGRNVG